MNPMLRFIPFLMVFFTLPLACGADESGQFFYTRTHLAIVRKNPPPAPALPWQAGTAATEAPAILFDVEVRNASVLYKQEGWFSFETPQENNGLLLTFNLPQIAPISRMTQYAPLDILTIDKYGRIIQVLPDIKLSELDQDLLPPSPILAFLFLRGGSCAKNGINPGDTVDYRIFKKPPAVLTTAPPANPSQPAIPGAPPPANTPGIPGATPPNNAALPSQPPPNASANTAPSSIQERFGTRLK